MRKWNWLAGMCMLMAMSSYLGCIGIGGGGTGTLVDSDGDGFSDIEERNGIPGSDPNNANDTPANPIDTDGDGCSDYDELNFINFCDNNPQSPGSSPADPDADNLFNLTVARHVGQPFTESGVDEVFASATSLLTQQDNDCPDVVASVTFQRDGSLSTFDIGDPVITRESDLDAIFDEPQDIKIVELLVGVCGVTDPSDMTVVIGCAATGGTAVVAALADPDVWAHEWGHVQGLGHRDDCPRNLMHTFEANTNALNEFERNAFLSPTPGGLAKALVIGGEAKAPMHDLHRGADESVQDWLERIIRRQYLSGIPRDVFANADAATTTMLADMLDDPRHQPYAFNVARALGLCGDASRCSNLTACVTSPTGKAAPAKLAEISEAMLALGRLSAHDESGQTLQWLIDGVDPAAWPALGIAWTYADGRNPSTLLARLSIKALTVAGPNGLSALEEIDRAITSGQLPASLATDVREAIAMFRTADRGIGELKKRYR